MATTTTTTSSSSSSALSTQPETIEQIVAEQPEISTIAARWETIYVSRIDNVRIANMARFSEAKTVNIGGPFSKRVTRDQVGMLCHSDAEIIVSLAEPARVSDLSLRLDNSVTVASRETLVTLGRLVQPYEQVLEGDQEPRSSFRIVVPLTRGLYDRVPLLDEIHTKGKHFVHHTISIAGCENGRPTEWKIRVRVDPEDAVVDVVSVNNSLIDAVRIGESWTNFRDLVADGTARLVAATRSCFASRKNGSYSAVATSDPDEHAERFSAASPVAHAIPAPIPVHASLYPMMPPQQPVGSMPPAGMMYVPAYATKTDASADPAQPQPQLIYYALPPSSMWPAQHHQQQPASPSKSPVHEPAAAAPPAPKFELVSIDEE